MYDALSFSYLLGTLAANNLISSTVSPQISIAWSATLSFSTHRVVQNFSGYKPLDETRKYFALLAGELCRNLNIARSTFLIDQELATTPVCSCILELLLVLGQLKKYYELCSSFCTILLPEEQSICVFHQVACIQKNSALLGGWRMKGLLIKLLRSGVILLSWSNYLQPRSPASNWKIMHHTII